MEGGGVYKEDKMKNIFSAVILTVLLAGMAAAQNVNVYKSQGGNSQTFAATSLLSMAGRIAFTPLTSYSSVNVSTSFSPVNSTFLVINGSGTITSTATPAISTLTAVSGQELLIMGGANVVTFQDNGTLSGSLLELGNTTRALGAGDILKLIYYSGKWYEIGFVNN